MIDGVKSAMQWDDKAGHGDGLSGESRDRVVMFAGTGSVRGWQGWLSEGRRTHSTGVDEWRRRKKRERTWSSGQTTENGDEADSDQTFVEDGKKDL